MLPAVVPKPIRAWRGDSLTIPVRVWSDAAQTEPVDLTGFGTVFAAQLRHDRTSTTDVAMAVDHSDADTGVLVLSLTPTQTAALAQDQYGFDVKVRNVDSTSVTTIVTGKIKVDGNFTRG